MPVPSLSIASLRDAIVGIDADIETPFGTRPLIYCDYTASGRSLLFVERYLQGLLQTYANTHTEDDLTGRGTSRLLQEAEQQLVGEGHRGAEVRKWLQPPRELPGAKVVDAGAVVGLLAAGAVYVDVRNDAEFKAGHLRGAQLGPYVERSAKDTEFDASQDGFEIERLPVDRDAALIFACNGPECWKSYKASHAALRAGYRKVYWFRGGLPEWRAAGLPLAGDS